MLLSFYREKMLDADAHRLNEAEDWPNVMISAMVFFVRIHWHHSGVNHDSYIEDRSLTNSEDSSTASHPLLFFLLIVVVAHKVISQIIAFSATRSRLTLTLGADGLNSYSWCCKTILSTQHFLVCDGLKSWASFSSGRHPAFLKLHTHTVSAVKFCFQLQ